MGFFSFITQDTNESIPSSYSERKTFTVYMKDNKGNAWKESEYEGYGVFGGKDYYELLAEMNGLPSDRSQGLTLAFSGQKHITPNLVCSPNREWVNEAPENCPDQGYFYED